MPKLTEAQTSYTVEIDPAWHLMPQDQIDRVLHQDMCDIAPEFLGFTNIYLSLASLIPKHWTVVDLGCAYAPQAVIFRDHAGYIGVDQSACERFSAPNTKHYTMTVGNFIRSRCHEFDQNTTFAICSYVPNWYGESPQELARASFKNVFTFYPASGKNRLVAPWAAGRHALEGGSNAR